MEQELYHETQRTQTDIQTTHKSLNVEIEIFNHMEKKVKKNQHVMKIMKDGEIFEVIHV
jgi:hypothetical protein